MKQKTATQNLPSNKSRALLQKMLQDAAVTNYPTPMNRQAPRMSEEEKIAEIAKHFEKIMEVLGLDLTNDSLADTPNRVAKMYVQELFKGLDTKNFPKITTTKNDYYEHDSKNMILIRDITLHSVCEHHFVPMIGVANIAYISNGTVLGLSKLNRIVEYFCKRPQLQERLTAQIADCMSILLGTEDVAVLIRAQHFCVTMRGIQDTNSSTVTHLLKGKFLTNAALHSEFLESSSQC